MIGLVIKDFVNLKKNIKIFSVAALLYVIMAFTSKDPSFFSSLFTVLIAMLTLNAYSSDEAAKWDIYALTMPVSREDIVRGKYAIMISLTLIGSAVGTVLTIVLNAVLGNEQIASGVMGCWIGAAIVILFYSITIPFITKLGVEKARLIFFMIYIIPFAIFFLMSNAIKDGRITISGELINIGYRLMDNAYVLLPLLLLFALAVSYTVSVRLYLKKEF